MKYAEIGTATTNAVMTNFRKSLLNKPTTEATLAPNTFLTPISLVLDSTVNIAKPNRPKHAIKIANPEAVLKT